MTTPRESTRRGTQPSSSSRGTTTISSYVRRLHANVDDFYADRVTYETFSERQRAIWLEVQLRGAAFDWKVIKALKATPDYQPVALAVSHD